MSKERALALAWRAARQLRKTMYVYRDAAGWTINTRAPARIVCIAVYVDGCQDTFTPRG